MDTDVKSGKFNTCKRESKGGRLHNTFHSNLGHRKFPLEASFPYICTNLIVVERMALISLPQSFSTDY